MRHLNLLFDLRTSKSISIKYTLPAAFVLFLYLTIATPSNAATYLVTSNGDFNGTTTDCNPGVGGLCTLRQAINGANYTPGDDIITFASYMANQTIVLSPQTNSPILVNSNIKIDATNAGGLRVSGGNAFTVFSIFNNSIVTMQGFTITNGAGGGNFGGAIRLNGSDLTLDKMEISNNSADLGGGIYTNTSFGVGSLTVKNSVVKNNIGGGIFSGGLVTLHNVILTDNYFSSNTLNIAGGGLYRGGAGGATLTNCFIAGNTVSASGSLNRGGGGVYFGGGTNYVSGTTFAGNSATDGDGGGFTVSNSTTLTVVNSTISGNSANNGGGFYAQDNAAITLRNVTIAANTATNSGGGIFRFIPEPEEFQLKFSKNFLVETLDLANTIVADNAALNNPDIDGNINSLGNNIVRNRGTSNGYNVNDLPDRANPRLAPLGNYGGIPLVYAISNNSPAVDNGNNAGTLDTDQRGATRQGNADIGAFEVNAAYVAVLPSGKIEQNYNQTIVPDNGNFTCTVIGGNLPPGLTLTTSAALAKKSVGRIASNFSPSAVVAVSGVPTMGGTYNFIVRSNNTNGNIVDTNYQIVIAASPTAASVTLSGRILNNLGRNISRARVNLTDASGEMRTTITNSFGYYHFDEVSAGQTYIISVNHKRYQFASQVLSANEIIENFDFIALP